MSVADAGVVDENVDMAAEDGGRPRGERTQLGVRAGQVDGDELGLAAGRSDLAQDFLGTAVVAAADRDTSAFGGQRRGDRGTNSAGGASNKRGAALKAW